MTKSERRSYMLGLQAGEEDLRAIGFASDATSSVTATRLDRVDVDQIAIVPYVRGYVRGGQMSAMSAQREIAKAKRFVERRGPAWGPEQSRRYWGER